jgi:hypothetical protein
MTQSRSRQQSNVRIRRLNKLSSLDPTSHELEGDSSMLTLEIPQISEPRITGSCRLSFNAIETGPLWRQHTREAVRAGQSKLKSREILSLWQANSHHPDKNQLTYPFRAYVTATIARRARDQPTAQTGLSSGPGSRFSLAKPRPSRSRAAAAILLSESFVAPVARQCGRKAACFQITSSSRLESWTMES